MRKFLKTFILFFSVSFLICFAVASTAFENALDKFNNPKPPIRYTIKIYKPVEKTFKHCTIDSYYLNHLIKFEFTQASKNVYISDNWIITEE